MLKPNRRFDKSWLDSSAILSVILTSFVFLVAFRATSAFRINIDNDESCYLARLAGWLGYDFSRACIRGGLGNYFAPGTALVWLPAGIIGRLWGWLTASDPMQWMIPVVAVYSYTLWGVSLYFLLRGMRGIWPQTGLGLPVRVASVFVLLNVPILYFATQWVVMPHTAELALVLGALVWIQERRWKSAFSLSLMAFLTRYNDFPIFFVFFAKLWETHREGKAPRQKSLSLRAQVTMALALLVAVGLLVRLIFFGSYGQLNLIDEVRQNFNIHNVAIFFFSSKWGMLWMCPLWVACLVYGTVRFQDLSLPAKAGWVWMVAEAVVCISWKDLGGEFAYRYLIGSYAGALVIAVDWIGDRSLTVKRMAFCLVVLGGVWMTYLTLSYKTIRELAPMMVDLPAGGGWVAHRAAGVPHFFTAALGHLLDGRVYLGMVRGGFPWATLYLSGFRDHDPQYRGMTIQGPGLLVLTLAILIATSIVAVALLKGITAIQSMRSKRKT